MIKYNHILKIIRKVIVCHGGGALIFPDPAISRTMATLGTVIRFSLILTSIFEGITIENSKTRSFSNRVLSYYHPLFLMRCIMLSAPTPTIPLCFHCKSNKRCWVCSEPGFPKSHSKHSKEALDLNAVLLTTHQRTYFLRVCIGTAPHYLLLP